MATNSTHKNRTDCIDPRPDHFVLGVDERGRHHVADTTTDTVHIIHPDGSRGRRLLDGGSIDDYVAAVADSVGWECKRYGQSLADHLIEVLDR